MKKKKQMNNNGISIADSIVMSVRTRKKDLHRTESVIIAVIGYISVIAAFLSMFDLDYEPSVVFFAAVGFSAFYVTLTMLGKKGMWTYLASVILFLIMAIKKVDDISRGFKYAYNTIYKVSFKTDIEYYKFLKPRYENEYVTILFVFALWLLAIVIYYFTICRPNPVLPLLVTFPILEIGLYNGVEISVFFAVMTVAYWLAVLAMSTIDIGEYSGGTSGFVRKDNLFYPKRNMRFKVTEKCGLNVILTIIAITVVTVTAMHITDYKRSDEINKKRIAISEAVNSFTFDDFKKSMSRLTSAFGFTLDYNDHRLGNLDHIRYKNVTDLTVDFSARSEKAVYLRDYTGAVYEDSSWNELSDSKFDNRLFRSFKRYSIYPQDFPAIFSQIYSMSKPVSVVITPKHNSKGVFAPYGTINQGELSYDRDMTVSVEKGSDGKYRYSCYDLFSVGGLLSDESIAKLPQYTSVYRSLDDVYDTEIYDNVYDYASRKGILNEPYYSYTVNGLPFVMNGTPDESAVDNMLMAELLENDYNDFVYDNYLSVPNNTAMKEILDEYSELIQKGRKASTAEAKLEVLGEIRDKMSDDVEYSLSPGKTPSNRDFVNYFLLENKKGYCVHYASAGVLLARMAGIPARYATGYIVLARDFNGDTLNKDGSYSIDVKDNRSHAWAEVYIDGCGWIPFEFTAGYSGEEMIGETTTTTARVTTTAEPSKTTTTIRKNRSTGTRPKSTTTHTTPTQTVTTAAAHAGHGGAGSSLPKSVQRIIYAAVTVLLILLAIVVRRVIILKIRRRRFTAGRSGTQIRYVYNYTEKLLGLLELHNSSGKFMEFAENVENHIGGTYIDRGSFEKLMKIALHSDFGNSPPDSDEMRLAVSVADKLAESIYSRSGHLRRLFIKYILAYI